MSHKPREILSDGENLIFEDYGKRKVMINENDYMELMMSTEKRAIRPALEECLKNPSEVWWNIEEVDGEKYSYYKYFKFYSNLIFIALVLIDDNWNFELNNFYGYEKDDFSLAEKERIGQPIRSWKRP